MYLCGLNDTTDFMGEMCTSNGFDVDQNDYVHRDQENKKQEWRICRQIPGLS
jgi:hypothetical protein